ncbi:hypothetical protein BH23VER1_BH23VER1_33190 [soil metagenome]
MHFGGPEILIILFVLLIPAGMALIVLLTLFFVRRGRKDAEASSPAARLAALQQARDQNLVTVEEFERKRAEILGAM